MIKRGRGFGLAACAGALLLLLFAAMSGALAAESAGPRVVAAWIKLPVIPGRPAAIYATLAGGAAADALLRVEGPLGTRTQLHRTRNDGGVMRMEPLARLDVPAGAKVKMAPGGIHVMLFGLGRIAPGTAVPLGFVFEKAGRVPVNAEARPATGDGAHGAAAHD